jgi:hypothetical protein
VLIRRIRCIFAPCKGRLPSHTRLELNPISSQLTLQATKDQLRTRRSQDRKKGPGVSPFGTGLGPSHLRLFLTYLSNQGGRHLPLLADRRCPYGDASNTAITVPVSGHSKKAGAIHRMAEEPRHSGAISTCGKDVQRKGAVQK